MPSFRVIVQASDADWRGYRRNEMQRALEQGIDGRFKRWRKVEDNANLEFWVQQIDKSALVGLRLTDRTMRHSDYKQANLPASLRPTVARALVWLCDVDPGDVVVDPTCGAGTLLIERALAGRHRALLGGDIEEEAARCATRNFGKKHRPRGICRWDALELPLRSGSADKIVCNLPWGHQVGSRGSLGPMYAGVLKEARRILKPGGRASFLTSEVALFQNALKSAAGLRLFEQLRGVHVLGRNADVFVVDLVEDQP